MKRRKFDDCWIENARKSFYFSTHEHTHNTYRCKSCDSSMMILLYASSVTNLILAPFTPVVVVVAPLFFASISPSCVELLLLSGCFWSLGEYFRHSFRFFFNFSWDSKYMVRNSLMSINLSAHGGHNGSLWSVSGSSTYFLSSPKNKGIVKISDSKC